MLAALCIAGWSACGGDSGPPITPKSRFRDNGDGTVSDTRTGLRWEKKDQGGGLHDVDTGYLWAGFCDADIDLCQPDAASASTCSTATMGARGCKQCPGPCDTSGRITIWQWLNQLNESNFAGHNDWRIPTVAEDGGTTELESILLANYPYCETRPCVDSVFNNSCTSGCTLATCSCTATFCYWSATTPVADTSFAWIIDFAFGLPRGGYPKDDLNLVRAVR